MINRGEKFRVELILILVVFQIFILVNSSPANSYIIRQQTSILDETIVEKKKDFFNLDEFGGLILNFFSIAQIGIVSAEESTGFLCCAKAKDNSTCQEFPASVCDEKCSSGCERTSCTESGNCKLGCCFDDKKGTCAPSSGRQKCADEDGKWFDEKMCNIQECKLGCCILGGETLFLTEKKCELYSGFYGFLKNFRADIDMEFSCYMMKEVKSKELGACVISGGKESGNTCKILPEDECRTKTKSTNTFYKGMLCSNPTIRALDINCQAQFKTACVDGSDEVYWFDSCGNKENIYDADKVKSFNNGMLLEKEKSCTLANDFSNVDKCGNCNRYESSTCASYDIKYGKKPIYGNSVCKKLLCVYKGTTRKNGESWCIYDGYIGDGRDVVGSRHWKYSCVDGEIKVEGCSDYRNGVCAYSPETKTASCRINMWRDCMSSVNADGSCSDDAGDDCETRTIEVGKLEFSSCTPKYPPGFMQKVTDAEDNFHKETGEVICAQANRKFIVYYEKKMSGWDCIYNCGIENEEFTQQMNDYCVSLGDCGGYVNIAGKITKNYEVEGADDIDLEQYAEFATPVDGQYASMIDVDAIGAMMGYSKNKEKVPKPQQPKEPGYLGLQTGVQIFGGVTGATGMIAGLMTAKPVTTTIATAGQGWVGQSTGVTIPPGSTVTAGQGGGSVSYFTNTPDGGFTTSQTLAAGEPMKIPLDVTDVAVTGPTDVTVSSPASPSFAQGFGNAMGSIGAASIAATVLSFAFGLKAEAALAMSIAGIGVGAGAAGLGYALAGTKGLSGCAFVWWAFLICLGILLIIAIILKSMKIGETKQVEVSFRCMTWEPPAGGEDCKFCNKDEPLKQCTKYRCESLGQTCSFNKTTMLCYNSESNDRKEPTIKPLEKVLTGGYKYKEVADGLEIRTSKGECIPQMNLLNWGISTNENTQCKMDVNSNVPYEKMGNFFGGKNRYIKEHPNSFFMPSLNLILKTYGFDFGNGTSEPNLTEMNGMINLSKFNSLDLYVKCMDQSGNINKKDYRVNFCSSQSTDNSSVEVVLTKPEKASSLKFGEKSSEVIFYLSEPAECRYDYSPKLYKEMNFNLSCKNDIMDWTEFGWPCNGTIQNVTSLIYLKCKDQPWEVEGKRNVNSNAYEYFLTATEKPLKIESISPPAGTILRTGFQYASVNLEVKTSGGAEKGTARCSYNFDELGDVAFSKSFSNAHEQSFGMLPAGNYNLEINCKDSVGNAANSSTNFKIDVDSYSPSVVRYFNENGILVVATDEKAKCSFSFENCNFDIGSGNISQGGNMDLLFSKTHKAVVTEQMLKDFTTGKTIFYIKCMDELGNKNPSCMRIGAY